MNTATQVPGWRCSAHNTLGNCCEVVGVTVNTCMATPTWKYLNVA